MPEHELWLTALFNDYLAGVANAILGLFNVHAAEPGAAVGKLDGDGAAGGGHPDGSRRRATGESFGR